MNLKQTLSKIYQKIKSAFRAVFKIFGWGRKIAGCVFKSNPILKRKVFMAGAVYFYNRFVGKGDRIEKGELIIRDKSGFKNNDHEGDKSVSIKNHS